MQSPASPTMLTWCRSAPLVITVSWRKCTECGMLSAPPRLLTGLSITMSYAKWRYRAYAHVDMCTHDDGGARAARFKVDWLGR